MRTSTPFLRLLLLLLLVVLGGCAGGQTADDDAPTRDETSTEEKLAPKTNAQIRKWYNEQVARIPDLNEEWKREGLNAEERARKAYEIRHNARIEARAMMQNKEEVEQLRKRDLEKYGNPDGPTFEYLVTKMQKKGLRGDDVYEAIIGSARRTNKKYNKKYEKKE